MNEAWAAGVLAVGAGPAGAGAEASEVPKHLLERWAERAAIMMYDGTLPRAEAERFARVCLQSERGG